MSRRTSGDQKIESIEPYLKNAVVQTRKSKGTVVEAQNLWNRPVERAAGDERYLEGTSSYTGKRGTTGRVQRFMRSEIWRFAVTAAAALLVIAGLSYYQLLVRVDTTVYLDVNPSFTMSLNRLDRVVGTESDNEDAEAVLAQTDLEGKTVDEAMESLLEAMSGQGYFSGEDSTVLLSVECASTARRAQMSEGLSEEIEGYLEKKTTTGGAIFCQTVQIDEETRAFAKSHSISSGKAALVLKLAKEHPEQDKEQMASYTMDELVTHLHDQNIDLRDSLDYRGEDLDQRWKREEERKEMGEQSFDSETDRQAGQGADQGAEQQAGQGAEQQAGQSAEQQAGQGTRQEGGQDGQQAGQGNNPQLDRNGDKPADTVEQNDTQTPEDSEANSGADVQSSEKTAPDDRESTGPELSQDVPSLKEDLKEAGESAQKEDASAKTTEETREPLTPGQEMPSGQ